MNNLNTQNFGSEQADKQSVLNNSTNEYKNKVNELLSNDATRELAKIFGLDKKQISKLTSIETNALSNTNEINNEEIQLAKMFGKYDEMMELNKPVLSLAGVNERHAEYENQVA